MHNTQFLVILSALLFNSSGAYLSDYFGIVHLLKSISFWTKLAIIWLFALLALYCIYKLLTQKQSCYIMKPLSLLSLPWSVHLTLDGIIFHSTVQQTAVKFMLVPLMAIYIIFVFFSHKFLYIFDDRVKNTLLTLQNKSYALDSMRLIFISGVSLGIQGTLLYLLICLLNFTVAYYKIMNVTYLNPRIQYTYLIMEIWTWISLVLAITRSQDKTSQIILEGSFLLLAYFAVFPSSQLVNLFQMKIQWNISMYKKTNPLYSDILIVYYALKIFKKSNQFVDPLINNLSPMFMYQIKNEIMRKTDIKESDHNEILSYSERSFGSEDTILKEFTRESIVYEVTNFLKRKRTLQKSYQKADIQSVLLIFQLFIENRQLSIENLYQMFLFIKESKNYSSKISLQIGYNIFLKEMKIVSNIRHSQNDELIAYERLEEKISHFIENELKRSRISLRQEFNNKYLKSYIKKKMAIRSATQTELISLQVKGISCLKLAFLKFFIEKYMNSDPFTAEKNFKAKMISISQRLSDKSHALASDEPALFVSTLPKNQMFIQHCNNKFRSILQYSQQKVLEIHSIIPESFRHLHQAACRKIGHDNLSLHEHSRQLCFFQALSSQCIYPGSLTLKIYTGFDQILALGICEIQQDKLINISLPTKDDKKIKQILGTQFVISSQHNNTHRFLPANNKEETIQWKFQTKNQENIKFIQAEKLRDQIDPLGNDFRKFGVMLGVLLILCCVGIRVTEDGMLRILDNNSRTNNIQNQFYRFIVSAQIYYPAILCNYQLSKTFLSEQQLEDERKYVLDANYFIQAEYSQFTNKLLDYAGNNIAIAGDLFQPISYKSQHDFTYLFQMLHSLEIQMQSSINLFRQEYDIKSAQSFLVLSLKVTHMLQNTDIFDAVSRQLDKEKQQYLIYRYVGYYWSVYLLNVFIVYYCLGSINISKKLQHFLRRSRLTPLLNTSLKNIALEFNRNFRLLQRNQFEFTEREINSETFFIKETSSTGSSKNSKSYQNFYPYKKFFCLSILAIQAIFGLLGSFLAIDTYPVIILSSKDIFESKLKLTRFVIDQVHYIEEMAIEALNSKKIWPQLYQLDKLNELNELIDEMNILQYQNIMEILRNFTMGHPKIRITENPCDSLIDCSEMDMYEGEKTEGLIVIKNSVYALLKQIHRFISIDPTYLQKFSMQDEVRQAIKSCRKMAFIINELFKLDTELVQKQVQSNYLKNYIIYLLMFALFSVPVLQLIRLVSTYRKYKKQIYRLLPLQNLLQDTQFSTQIHSLIATF